MKRLNTKLISISAAIVFVLVTGTWGLHKFQTSRNADAKIRSADRSREEGDLERARWLYGAYLNKHPRDAARFKTYATISLEYLNQVKSERQIGNQDYGPVYVAVEEALRLNPEDIELLELAAKFSFEFYAWPDAATRYKELVTTLGDKATEEMRRNLVLSLQRAGNVKGAIDYLAQWTAYNTVTDEFTAGTQPAEAFCDAYTLLAELMRAENGNPDAAERIINRMVEENSENYNAYLSRVDYIGRARLERKEQVTADLEKALELAPQEPSVVLQVARHLLIERDMERVKQLLDGLLVTDPKNIEAYALLSQRAGMLQQPDLAIEYANKGLVVDPKNQQLLWMKGMVLLEQKDFDELARVKTTLKGTSIRNGFVEFLTGRELMIKGKWWEAQKVLDEVRLAMSAQMPDMVMMVDGNLAECYERLGQHDRRLAAFNRILETEPTNEAALWGRIDCLVALDQIPQSLDEYRKLVGGTDKIEEIPTAYILKHLQMEVLTQEQRPKEERVWTRVTALVKRVTSLENVTDTAKLSVVAAALHAMGDEKRAAEAEKRLKDLDPSNITVALQNVTQLAKTDANAALKELDEVEKDFGKPLAIRLLRLGLVAQIGGGDMHATLAKLEEDAATLPPKEQSDFYDRMAKHRLLLQEFGESKRLWTKCLDTSEDPLSVYQQLFELAIAIGDVPGMDEARAGVLKIAGEGTAELQWMDAAKIAWLVTNQQADPSELKKARLMLVDAQGKRSNWDALYLLDGNIALQMGDTTAARLALETALKYGPPRPNVLRRLAEICYEAQEFDQAEAWIRKIDESMWNERDKRMVTDIQARNGKLPETFVFDKESRDPEYLIWSSQLLFNAGRLEASLEAARLVTTNSPSLPAGWQNLVRVLVAQNKLDDARKAIQDAQLEVAEQDAPRLLGTCFEMLGEYGEAERYFRLFLENSPNDPIALRSLASLHASVGRYDDAMKYLNRLVESSEGSIKRDLTSNWARRSKARILAASQNFGDFNEALQLIEQNIPEGSPISTEDLLLWGRLSADRTDEFSRARALTFFDKVAAQRPLTEPEQLLLAELYEKQGRWSDCKNQMQSLLANNPNDLKLLAPWLDWLLQHDDLTEAERWLRNCPENSIVSLLTRAQLLVRRGRTDEAKKLISQLIPKGDLTPDTLGVLMQVSRLLEQLAKYDASLYDASEKLMREYLKHKSHESLELATFLGRRGGQEKIDEAIGICEKFFKEGQQRAALAAANSVIYANRDNLPLDSPLFDRIRGWFDDAQQQEPESAALLMQRSDFENAVQNFDAVEKWLRAYLKSDKADPTGLASARNNLAYLLALRGEGDESLKLIQSAIADLGPRAELRDTRATVLIARKEYDKALEDVTAAMNEAGETPFRLFRQAFALTMKGDKPAAEEAFKKATEMGLSPSILNKLEIEQYDDLRKRLNVASETLSATGN